MRIDSGAVPIIGVKLTECDASQLEEIAAKAIECYGATSSWMESQVTGMSYVIGQYISQIL